MPIVRSYTQPFEVTDLTPEINLIPNTWGLINELGIFGTQSVAQNAITLEYSNGTLAVVPDQPRGVRNTVNKDDNRKMYAFQLTHHPLDDYISPRDLAGKRAYGNTDAAENEAAVTARKLNRMRMNHAITLEAARAYTLTTGLQYAPNGTVSTNFYSDFGITRTEVDFVLGTATTNITDKIEAAIASIQDTMLSGEIAGGFVALCSPEFFGKLIKQANVVEAYKYYSSTQEPLRQRLGSGIYRRFVHGGIEFIEYRGVYNGARLIPAGDAYILPTGTMETFQTYFGPAEKFDTVNTLGEQTYVWSYRDAKNEKIELESESNFLNILRRPQTVVRAFSSN
jgi:Phage major capsid protein E